MDVKQALDGVMANPAAYARSILLTVVIIAALIALFKVGPRLWRVVEEVFFTNWQLAMLGTAAIVLSLAGGWTTWDGMTNFTGEPVLSLMFTFGIHGVMLIVAWLIGESFATGMSTVPRSGITRVTAPLVVVILVGAALLAAGFAVYQWNYGIQTDYVIQALIAAGLLVGVLGLLTAFARTDVVAPYAQALRIMVKNSMLWVMFLACMATSVFFSFDSRFNVVFPQEQRERVSETARHQPGLGHHRRHRRHHLRPAADADVLAVPERGLAAPTRASSTSSPRRRRARPARSRSTSTTRSKRATAASRSSRSASPRRRAARPASPARRPRSPTSWRVWKATARRSPPTTPPPRQSSTRAPKTIDAKRVEAMAESKGVEGTLKEGRGPVYRQIMGDLGKLQAAFKIQDDRVKDAKKRLDTAETRISQIKRELATIDGELAKYKGEEETAGQRIQMAQENHRRAGRGAARRSGPRAAGLRNGARRVPPASRRGAPRRGAAALLAAL